MDLDILRRSPLFATLDDAAFKLLTDDIQEIDLSRNAVLFYEGDQGDQLFAVLSGKVKLGRTAADGRENMVALMGPGDQNPGTPPAPFQRSAGRPCLLRRPRSPR